MGASTVYYVSYIIKSKLKAISDIFDLAVAIHIYIYIYMRKTRYTHVIIFETLNT